MVMITTFIAPPSLRALLTKRPGDDPASALSDVVTEAFSDDHDRSPDPAGQKVSVGLSRDYEGVQSGDLKFTRRPHPVRGSAGRRHQARFSTSRVTMEKR